MSPHSGVGAQSPLLSWQGVMSTPECSSIHGIAMCISEKIPPWPHWPPPEVMPKARQVSSPPNSLLSLMNTGPPESP